MKTRKDSRTGGKNATVFFDKDGVVQQVQVARDKPRRLYTYVEGFMVVSIDGLRMLGRMKLRGQALRVLFALFGNMDGNLVAVRLGDLAAFLEISASHLSRAINELDKAGILRRTSVRGNLRVNPHYAFRGSAQRQVEAAKEWDAATRKLGVVPIQSFGATA